MAIYCDDIQDYGEKGKRCHCWGDSEAELLLFARQLRIPLGWKHTSFSALLHRAFPHFDLSPTYRKRALARGAKEMTIPNWIRQEQAK